MCISKFKNKLGILSKWHPDQSRINQPNYLLIIPFKYYHFPLSNGRNMEEYGNNKNRNMEQ